MSIREILVCFLTLVKITAPKRLALTLLAITTGLTSFSVQASPWIETGNARTRHHIQYLVDSGVLNIPTSTWPLAWVSVKQALESVDTASLTPAQGWSIKYLKHELQKVMGGAYTQARSHTSASAQALEGFESSAREAREIETGIIYTGDQFAMKLTGTYVDDPTDNKSARADGSFLAFLLGNWATGVGAIDQWWGPGWHNSMVLSHNARPAPGFFLKRNQTQAFATPLLRWLGQWQFTTFVNQLQDKTGPIEKPLLLGARFSATPLQGLEVGLSRTAMRNGDAKTTNNPPIGTKQNYSLAAIDARYGFSLGANAIAFYGQVASQSGFHSGFQSEIQNSSQNSFQNNNMTSTAASHNIAMAGVEFSRVMLNTHHRIIFESSNSAASFYKNEPSYNTAYEHSTYEMGYRHLGRSIAASSDGDSEVVSLAGQHYFDNGHQFSWRLAHANLNRGAAFNLNTTSNLNTTDNLNTTNLDTTATMQPGGSAFGPKQTKVDNTQIQYRLPVNDKLMVEIGGSYFSEQLMLNGKEIKSSLHLSLFHHW